MKKFALYVLPLLLIASMLLAACGGGEAQQTPAAGTGTGAGTTATTAPQATTATQPTTAAQPTAAATEATAAQPTAAATEATAAQPTGAAGGAANNCGAVELTYWNPFTGPDGPFMGQMVDAFNAEHPDIKVTMTSQGEYYTQLTTAAAADTLPDVAIVHADQVATQAFRNVLRPMDDLVTDMGIDAGDYPDAVWAAGEIAGKRYALPLDIHPMTMFYNTDLFEEAGVANPPTNREEFEAAAAAITKGDNKGFDITGGFPIQQIFQMLLAQFGGQEFNEEGTEAVWNSEEGVQALTWMKEAQSKFSESNLEVDAEINAFKSGTVGMFWNGIWQTTNVTGDAVEFNGQATAVPQIGSQPAVWAGSHQLTLPSHKTVDPCKDQAAATFIKYLVDNSVTWAKAGQIPASATVRNSDEFKAIEPQASIAPSVENAVFPPAVPGITDAYGPMGEAVGAIMNGTETDIQAALDSSVERANQILAENRTTYGEAPTGQ